MASTQAPTGLGGDPCEDFVRAAFVCIQVTNPTECGCFAPDPTAFMSTFPADTQSAFMSSMAFTDPSNPQFCDVANEKVCQNYEANHSCCCTFETEEARKCLVSQVYSNQLPMPLMAPCSGECAVSSEGGGDDNMMIIIGAAAGGAVLLLCVVFYMWWRRRRAASNDASASGKDGNEKDKKKSKKSGSNTSKGSHSKEGDEDIEEGGADVSSVASSFRSKSSSSSSSSSSEEESAVPVERAQVPPPPVVVQQKEESRSDGKERRESSRREREHRDRHHNRSSQRPSSRYEDEQRRHHHHHHEREPQYGSSADPPPAEEKYSTAVPSKAAEQDPHLSTSKTDELRKKREAIETWNKDKKYGSNRSLSSYASGASSSVYTNDTSKDESGVHHRHNGSAPSPGPSGGQRTSRNPRSEPAPQVPMMSSSAPSTSAAASAETKDELMEAMQAKLDETTAALTARMERYQRDLEKVAIEKHISKKRVKALSEDREATTLRLSQLEEARTFHEGRLQAAEHEVESLRKERIDAASRIADLEAQNAHLQAQLRRSAVMTTSAPQPGAPAFGSNSSTLSTQDHKRLSRKSSRQNREKNSSDMKRAVSAGDLVEEGSGHEGGRRSHSSSRRRRDRHHGNDDIRKSASSEDLETTSWNHNSIQTNDSPSHGMQ